MAKINLEAICKNIVLAQIASDAGKSIYELQFDDGSYSKAVKYAYKNKSNYLLRAIQQIDSSPYIGIRYFVSEDTEFNGVICYFQIKLANHKTIQASFHVPGFDENMKKFLKYTGRRKRIRWDEKSSRYTCFCLIEYFGW